MTQSFYSLEIGLKRNNFKPVFLTTGKMFWKIFTIFRITTERALIWYITWVTPMLICGKLFNENKKKQDCSYQGEALNVPTAF